MKPSSTRHPHQPANWLSLMNESFNGAFERFLFESSRFDATSLNATSLDSISLNGTSLTATALHATSLNWIPLWSLLRSIVISRLTSIRTERAAPAAVPIRCDLRQFASEFV